MIQKKIKRKLVSKLINKLKKKIEAYFTKDIIGLFFGTINYDIKEKSKKS